MKGESSQRRSVGRIGHLDSFGFSIPVDLKTKMISCRLSNPNMVLTTKDRRATPCRYLYLLLLLLIWVQQPAMKRSKTVEQTKEITSLRSASTTTKRYKILKSSVMRRYLFRRCRGFTDKWLLVRRGGKHHKHLRSELRMRSLPSISL